MPFPHLINSTKDFYRFTDPQKLEQLRKAGLIEPFSLLATGYVDFVRKNYTNYPYDAVKTIKISDILLTQPIDNTNCPFRLECPILKL